MAWAKTRPEAFSEKTNRPDLRGAFGLLARDRFGPLRFVPRQSGPSLLVVDGLRGSVSRKTGQLRGFRRATGRAGQSGQGATTVVMFLLVPQVKLPKRLDVTRAAERWSAQLPGLIEQQLRSE